MSLEVEEDIPLERSISCDQPKKEKKKDKRKKDSGESVHDDARRADVNKDAKASKQRKKPSPARLWALMTMMLPRFLVLGAVAPDSGDRLRRWWQR